jgi:hypothetical protein
MKLSAVIVLLLTGCASADRESALDAQEEWLRGLGRGQPIQHVTLAVVPGTQYSLEIFDHGQIYQYIGREYPITETLYGLYFAAGRLKALVLDQDARDFYYFEGSYRRTSDQWLQSGMARTNDWVETHDLLGREFDARMTLIKDKTEATSTGSGMDAVDVIEIATYFPHAVFALPGYSVYLLAGGGASDNSAASEEAVASEQTVARKETVARAASQRAQLNVGKLYP